MLKFYAALLDRFQDLHREARLALEALPPEAWDWRPSPGVNPLTVLIIHLAGAERFWIGDVVRGDSSQRDRAAEFEAHGLEAAALRQRLEQLDAYEAAVFAEMRLDDLDADCRSPRDGRQHSVAWALSHALEHTAVHVGQIQTLKQLWLERPAGG